MYGQPMIEWVYRAGLHMATLDDTRALANDGFPCQSAYVRRPRVRAALVQ